MAGAPIWYELMTPDPGAVASFYRGTLGWEIPAAGHDMPNGSQYREIRRADGGHAGGVLTLTPQMAGGGSRPGWMVYFEVDDVDNVKAEDVFITAEDKQRRLEIDYEVRTTFLGNISIVGHFNKQVDLK